MIRVAVPWTVGALIGALMISGPAFAKRSAVGQPAIRSDERGAYWLWSDASGWHLRMTGAKGKHRFRGVIRSERLITAAKTTRPELARAVAIEPNALRFDLQLESDGDGLDWRSDTPCLTFELKVDGRPQPERILVGTDAKTPNAIPFDACQ